MNKEVATRMLSLWGRSDALISNKRLMLDKSITLLNRSNIAPGNIGVSAHRSGGYSDKTLWSVIQQERITESIHTITQEIENINKVKRHVEDMIIEEFGGSCGKPRHVLLSHYRDNQTWKKIAEVNNMHTGDLRLLHTRIIYRIAQSIVKV